MKSISEIRNNFIDDQNLQHIDCWFTESENEEGVTVAVVDLDSRKVIFFDNGYRLNEQVKDAIREILGE